MEILWNYDNVTSEKENNYISTFDGKDWNRLTFPDGYYTFNALVKELKKRNITLTYDPNTLLSTVETKSALRLRRLGMLLGFDSKNFFNGKRTQVLWSFCTPNIWNIGGTVPKFTNLQYPPATPKSHDSCFQKPINISLGNEFSLATYIATFLSGTSLKNLTDDNTPNVIKSIARFHVSYTIARS